MLRALSYRASMPVTHTHTHNKNSHDAKSVYGLGCVGSLLNRFISHISKQEPTPTTTAPHTTTTYTSSNTCKTVLSVYVAIHLRHARHTQIHTHTHIINIHTHTYT